ncbi:tRNA glutamyl-Q(34) synthetase GluQRS [Cohnella pontilimi]|uniref:Glutamyl-Q tRNA(Asp) synthetase n=1 Tax=Cohnella pontilimi TaxID=2564100 RepID=A0A4U0FGZ1_9BACL|nr:tRNA glutamyl-Q(34) synthetase GluQRS [Cohnella pontilimi]TJY44170.1 tRNA glutamyl-Q(34) synthetase GluQRS [Cohnella pontilimi]
MPVQNEKVRGRFAPTPSGLLHLGNAGTALLAWLQVRSLGGTMVLRIEDLDRPRCKPEWTARSLEDMRWLGLDWDEGPDSEGPYAPYEQSKRGGLYTAALDRLERESLLYRCYCSRADLLSIANAPHGLSAEGPAYPGTCRGLSDKERAEREAGKTPSLRFALPDKPVQFEDGIAGLVHFTAGSGGDFVVKRADGIVGYQLAVVIDDMAMEITDVLRGWDLLESTPRQLLLYEALGGVPPRFAHAPLMRGPDGSRLAKRHGDIALNALRESGVSPERIVGLMGWLYGLLDLPHAVKAKDLIPAFDLSRIPKESVALPADWRRIVGLI